MDKNLHIKLLKITENYNLIQKQLSSSEISTEKRIELSKKFSSLEQIIIKKNEVDKIEKSLAETQKLLEEKLDEELEELQSRRNFGLCC